MTGLPLLDQLHLRHQGLTANLCGSYAEAASVCLSRHHQPPVDFDVSSQGGSTLREVNWLAPDDRVKRAWNNDDDATRDGAYALSIAAAELDMGLFAVARAETRTGADYYLADQSTGSLERAFRLEVSGVDHGNRKDIERRVSDKVKQTQKPPSNVPAIVAVVGFRERWIAIQQVT